MVAIVAGAGLGLERSSGLVLGSLGQLGGANVGRAGDNVYVNAANGNLVVRNADEMLFGLGPDDVIDRTYNSLATTNWQRNVNRQVTGLTGTVNTSGSTVKRIGADGSDVTYTYDTGRGLYVARQGDGGYDTLSFSGSAWTYTDGASRVVELYDSANGGRITSSTDADGNALTFTYNGSGQLTQVTTADGGYTSFVYSGTLLTQVVTTYLDAATSTTKTLTRVRYGYDGSNRLSTVTVDLTPGDNSIADGKTYVTTYGYDGASNRVSSITQTDGSSLQIAYTLVGSTYRVSSLTETSAAGVTRVTSLSYDTVNRITTVTDPLGQATSLAYDATGQLTQITAPPAVSGGSSQVTQFAYNAMGDVLTVTLPGGNVVTYTYDANGNRTKEMDAAGNTVTRTFGAANQVLTETRYLVPDPDGAGPGSPSSPVTVRYAYDVENHLRYVVSAEGYVTEYRYDAQGRQTSAIEYAGNVYNISGLGAITSISEGTLNSWVAGIADLSTSKRTDTAYDFRGNVTSVTAFGKVLANGSGDTAATTEVSKTFYIYDQFGKLLSRQPATAGTAEVYVYDGLGRLVASTDFDSATTSVQFDDANSKTIVTLANGLVQTSTYNLTGELISYSESGTGVTTATTTYRYDAAGRLRIITDATGQKSYILYDNVGRRVADIQADGSLIEYGYNANNQLVKTIAYQNKLSGPQLASLVDGSGNPTSVGLSSVRPTSNAADRWSWSIYDSAQRLIETIDASGAAVVYAYDGASRLISTTAYANLIAAGTVTGFKTTTPTTLQLPTANATADRVTRTFYDADGHQIGALDVEGYLTQVLYDGAGQAIHTIRFATVTTAGLRATGTFAQLLTSVGTAAGDIHQWAVYDSRGFMRAAINGEGDLTRYHYNALGDVDQVITGQKLNPATLITTPPTLANLPAAPGGTVLDTTAYTHNLYGQVLTETRTLAGAASETTTYSYDNMRRLVRRTTAGGTANERVYNQIFDLRGRLTGALDGVGSAALAALGGSPTPVQIANVYATYGVTYVYDEADRLISKKEANGVDATGNRTLYYYDANGRLTYEVNALGEVLQYGYNSFSQRSEVTAYANRIASGTLATLTGGAITGTLTGAITANPSQDSTTHLDFNVTGTISQSLDALGVATTYAYNAFGDLTSRTDPISSGVTAQTTRSYDRRGLLLTETRDAAGGGLQLVTSYGYDAFGREIQVTNPAGQVRTSGYDRAGRVVSTKDALNQTTTFTYDGRGNLLTKTDRTGKITSWAYTEFNRQVTMTTPESVVTTTAFNPYGQTVSITDGAGRQTTWTYDKDGNVKSVADAAGTTQYNYDYDGRLAEVVDARGAKTKYTYDAANRVLTRKVDDGGLNLTTTYQYDAKGQQVQVTDPAGTVTTVAFDKAGRKTTVVVDPGAGHLAITTTYAYDQRGRVLTLTEASGTAAAKVTQYVYDKADRLTQTKVNPSGLNLTTTYTYDAAGNVVAKTDASGAKTRFVYDAENRQIYAVDAVGGVVANTYDAEGRVTSTRGYVNTIAPATLAGFPLAITAANVTSNVTTNANDRLTSYVYDGDGRLRFQVDANARPTEYIYDGAGNVIRTIDYAGVIAPTASYTLAYVQGQITSLNLGALAGNRTTRAVYDAANRQAFAIDATGAVTAFAYDANGNVVKATRYKTLYGVVGDQPLATMQSWATTNANAADRVSRTVYDAANRAVYAVDAESYVTEQQYDAAGRVTKQIRYAAKYTVTDGVTQASLSALIGALPPTAAVTSYTYDLAGRLTNIVDPIGTQTRMVLDAMGRVVDYVEAYGAMAETTTRNVWDAAGRLTSATKAYGAAEATTTSYTYDGMGRALTIADGRGFTTTQVYDALGRVTQVTTPLDASTNAVTQNQYDAFSNLVKVTDPRGNVGFFYYDRLNRQDLQLDPEGYATATTYTIGDEVASVTRYAVRPTGTPTVTTRPTIVTNAKDATTTFGRDKLDRLTSVTDAQSYTESYGLNAFGDRVTVTNKLGGVTTNTFDKRGLLLSETLPINSVKADGTVQAASVTNTFVYDARGNRTQMVEATGLIEQRTTTYTYDLIDRLLTKTGDAVQVTAQDLQTVTSVTPTESYSYDRRGNLLQTVDANGARTLFYYDRNNRRIAQIDALGGYTAWTYDANGNVLSERAYATAITLPGGFGGAPPSPVNPSQYRETTFAYDRNNRLTSSTVASVLTGEWNGSSFATTTANVVTQYAYDLAGNRVQQTDPRGNSVFTFYDKLGRVTAQVDQKRFLTFYTLDAEGNVLTEERFATQVASVSTSSNPTTLRSSVAGNADDRVTTFTYDKNGRRLTETRANVNASVVNTTTGVVSAGATNATITYAYNGLGQVTSKTEATGDQRTFTYDLGGRQTSDTGASFLNLNGLARQRQAQTFYDGLGNVTRIWEGAAGISAPATDKVTTYSYGAGGRMATATDAAGFTRTFAYDAAGRIVKESHDRLKSDGTYATEATAYRYDALGRGTFQAMATWNGTSWVFGDQNQVRYDVFGAVTGKGVNGMWQETFDYDATGRLWRSTEGDGTTKLYMYDANGNQTLLVQSNGADLATYGSISALIPVLTNSGANTIGAAAISGMAVTINAYDKRNQLLEVREPFREINQNASNPLINDMINILWGRNYNAFGELIIESDRRGYVTNYTYNTLGNLIKKESPLSDSTNGTGAIINARPTETYKYDASGRLVAVVDTRGISSSRLLLAGSGYGGTEALATKEFHPDGGIITIGYDAYARQRTLTNELGAVETRNYDQMDRLTFLYRPQRSSTGTTLTEYYAYDGLGQRIQHWNSQLGSSVKETIDYDAQGRIIQTVDYGGATNTYAYSWNAALATTGLATFGGWSKTTTTPGAPNAQVENMDYFGRMLSRSDFGGHSYSFSYDKAGRLTSQTNSAGQNLSYTYFNTGRQAIITDASGRANTANFKTKFGYDANGNKVSEKYLANYDYWIYDPLIGSIHMVYQTVFQNATATYDQLNRMISYTDSGQPGASAVSMVLEYTPGGDVRRMAATYTPVGGGASTTQDYWYTYDSMNRMVITQGSLVGARGSGSIQRGYTGTTLGYDLAGQRVSATQTIQDYDYTWGYWDRTHVETFGYTEDGFLATTTIADSTLNPSTGVVSAPGAGTVQVVDVRDAMGRVTSHTEYLANGSTVAFNRTATYDNRSLVTTDTTSTLQYDGSTMVSTTNYDYLAEFGGLYIGAYMGGVVTHSRTTNTKWVGGTPTAQPTSDTVNSYTWWDAPLQSMIITNANWPASTIYTSTFTYDANGHVESVSIADGRPRTVSYLTDQTGQILSRVESSSAPSNPQEYYYVFDGVRLGDIGNNGTSNTNYATAIANRSLYPSTGPFKFGAAVAFADFDQSYDAINPTSRGEASTASSYTVRSGDTLRKVAETVWGDASLWYLIADANGLNGAETLAVGTKLTIPANVSNVHNNSETFRVYDPNKALGDVQPSQAAPPKKKDGCGGFGKILMIIVAVAVTAILKIPLTNLVAGYGTSATALGTFTTGQMIAGGALAATAGNIASQGVGLATGVQDKFSWKGVALAALSGGVAGGLSSALPNEMFGGNAWVGGAVRGAAGNAITQGVATAAGLQNRFDWAGVAVGGIVGGVASGVSSVLPGANAAPWTAVGITNGALSGTAAAIAGAGAQSLLNGTDFGDNILRALPDVIGSTIGNAIAAGVQQRAVARADLKAAVAGDLARRDENLGLAPGTSARDKALVGQLTQLREDARYNSDDWSGSTAALKQTERLKLLGATDAEAAEALKPLRDAQILPRLDLDDVPSGADVLSPVTITARRDRGLPAALVPGVSEIDRFSIKSGEVLGKVAETINERPALKFTLQALDYGVDIAAGPQAFVARQTFKAAVGELDEAVVGRLSTRFESVGYEAPDARSGGVGAVGLGSLIISGTTGLLKVASVGIFGAKAASVAREVGVSRTAHPEAAQHILDAQAAGHPVELTIDRAGAAANRSASLQGLEKVPGKQLDEYPPAMFKEGGRGASVRPISPADNMGSGASIGNQIRKLPDGSKVRIIVRD